MLRLLDRIIPTPTSTKNAVDKKKGQARQLSSDSSNANAPSSFSQFLPEYKCSLRAHSGGPIFSLQWLPMPSLTAEGSEEEASGDEGYGARQTRYYSLATGSVDRAVRIWGIACSSTEGLKVTPVMILDTLTTHVLSMHSFLRARKAVRSDSVLNKDGRLLKRTGAGSSIYLAAGTNIGSIYVWSIETKDLFGAVHGRFPVKLIDDGSKLHSLLQTSNRPIISVGLSLGREQQRSSAQAVGGAYAAKPHMIMVAADARGCVRTHRESEDLDLAEFSGSHHAGSRTPITLCGEANFDNMVVACAFQENSDSTVKSQKGLGEDEECDSGYEKKAGKAAKWKGSRLLLGTTEGNVQILKSDTAFYPPPMASMLTAASGESGDEAEEGGDDNEEGNEDEDEDSEAEDAAARNHTSRKKVSMDLPEAPKEASKTISAKGPQNKRGPASSSGSAKSKGAVAFSTSAGSSGKLFVDTSMDDETSPPKKSKDSAAVRFDSPEVATLQLINPDETAQEDGPSEHEYDQMDAEDGGDARNIDDELEDEEEEVPRPPPLVKQDSLPFNVDKAGRTPRPPRKQPGFVTSSAGRTPRPVKKASFAVSDAGRTPKVKGAAEATPESVFFPPEESPVAVKGFNSRDAGRTPKARSSGGASAPPPTFAAEDPVPVARSKRGGSAKSVRISNDISVGHQQPEASVAFSDEAGARGAPAQAMYSSTEVDSEPEPNTTVPKPSPSPSKAPTVSESAFSSPSIRSSQGLGRRVAEVKAKLDSDDVSISTIETTDSDRLAAARLVNVPLHAPKYSSSHLTKIPSKAEVGASLKTKGMPPKAVDQDWLHNRRSLGPTKEDVRCLWAPDPEVTLRYNPPKGYPGSRVLSKAERKTKSTLGGSNDLFASTDPQTLAPSFTLDLNSEHVFGKVDAAKAWQDGDEAFVDAWESELLSSHVSSVPV